MTRKCAICKETNYKNGSSFFSAPKDPEVRKLWQEAIGIDNYVVGDDTYVCSKHFYPIDIITHWISGVPPHVITIKYKKFRLRPGAIPKVNIDPDNMDPQFVECNSEIEANRSISPSSNPLSPTIKKNEETFSIPREDFNEKKVETRDFEGQDSQQSFENISDFSPEPTSQDIRDDYNFKEGTKLSLEEFETQENEFHKAQDWEAESTLIDIEDKKQIQDIFGKEEVMTNNDDQIMPTGEENTSFNSSNLSNETMLFEDLLEIYTEVNLPKGWISFVIPKGHGTTIVYAFTKINNSGTPFVEKQVFVKNNMLLRCSVKDRNVDPLMYNLIKDNKNLKVQTLMDVEELIIEFNKRQVCDGSPVLDLVNMEAFREASNWRHASCSLIINNGLTKCSKCASLGKRKSSFDQSTYSVCKSRLVERKEKIKVLNESIKKQVESLKGEECLPSLPLRTVSLLSEVVDLLKLPKIQKIMIKECFKLKNYGEENVRFSRTWIFLCLLLYIESPKMYKYLLLNKYMNLPALFTVRAFLRRIKVDREFYNIFQESIETFQ